MKKLVGKTVRALTDSEVQAISRAVADPRRFEILQQIATSEGVCTPCTALRECMPISPATLSHHVSELVDAGLVEQTRRGKFMDLRFRRDTWAAYLAALSRL